MNKFFYFNNKYRIGNKIGFTLAEVLIVIAIIGIVATIILPTINKDIKDKQYEVARKKILATLGESIKQISIQGEIKDANNSQEFVENVLGHYLKIIQNCNNDNLRACGIETKENKILTVNEIKTTMPKQIADLGSDISNTQYLDKTSKSYGFVMADGYSINLFYNPNCRSNIKEIAHNSFDMICVNAIYDMNGLSGPNQFGKDIGTITVMYPDNESIAIAPVPYPTGNSMDNFYNSNEICTKLGGNYSVPDKNELTALLFNGNYTGVKTCSWGSTSSAENDNSKYWIQCGSSRSTTSKTNSAHIRCVKR